MDFTCEYFTTHNIRGVHTRLFAFEIDINLAEIIFDVRMKNRNVWAEYWRRTMSASKTRVSCVPQTEIAERHFSHGRIRDNCGRCSTSNRKMRGREISVRFNCNRKNWFDFKKRRQFVVGLECEYIHDQTTRYAIISIYSFAKRHDRHSHIVFLWDFWSSQPVQ